MPKVTSYPRIAVLVDTTSRRKSPGATEQAFARRKWLASVNACVTWSVWKFCKRSVNMASKRSKVARAWKDPAYRERLSADDKATIPPNPAGEIDMAALSAQMGLSTAQREVLTRTGLISLPTMLIVGNTTTGHTQCTAHTCRVVFDPTIRVNPEKTRRR